LRPLAHTAHVRARAERKILAAQAGSVRRAAGPPGAPREGARSLGAHPRSADRGRQEGRDLRPRQEAHQWPGRPAARNGQHPLDQRRMRRLLVCGVPEELRGWPRAGRCGSGSHSPAPFLVIEEGTDQGRVQVGQVEAGRRCPTARVDELEHTDGTCPGRTRWCAGSPGVGAPAAR